MQPQKTLFLRVKQRSLFPCASVYKLTSLNTDDDIATVIRQAIEDKQRGLGDVPNNFADNVLIA
ncbi:hypothetical protein OH492_19635 [Vibrio chagasii]|nr:hypothetical protein [Vibrio chagasii]